MIALPRVVPGGRLLGAGGQIWATMRAEIVMQWRRWGLWVTFACVAVILILLTAQAAIYLHHLPPTSMYVRQHFTSADFNNLMIDNTATYGSMFLGLVIALLVVDRVSRDQRLGMNELQRATPQGDLNYLLGKFLGNTVALFALVLLIYLLCALVTVVSGWPPVLFLKSLQAFGLVFIPSSLAAVGVTLLLSILLPLRVVQVGFSLLWLYFNTGLGVYGFGGSIVNPGGLYVYPVFFPLSTPLPVIYPHFQTSLQLALLNIAMLLLIAVISLVLAYGNLALQRRHGEGA